jgi:DNA-directed RNA polymerase beta' subunit
VSSITIQLSTVHLILETVISIDTAAAGIKQSTKAVDLSNELQQKSKHIDEMIENRKENIGVIDKKTGDILANIDEVKDAVVKHLNDVTDKMKEKVTSLSTTGSRMIHTVHFDYFTVMFATIIYPTDT